MAATFFSDPHALAWQASAGDCPPRFSAAIGGLRASDLESHRPALTRYAMRALRNSADAEDVVQDTLAAAMESPSFAGRSSLTSWLHGILKHKVIDTYRRKSRETALDDVPEHEWQPDDDAPFTPEGAWREAPASWGSPEAALARRDFFQVLEGCIASLPESAARVFTMREIMELEVNEICAALGISPNHCFVTLHRARMKLRALLQERWFAPQAPARA